MAHDSQIYLITMAWEFGKYSCYPNSNLRYCIPNTNIRGSSCVLYSPEAVEDGQRGTRLFGGFCHWKTLHQLKGKKIHSCRYTE